MQFRADNIYDFTFFYSPILCYQPMWKYSPYNNTHTAYRCIFAANNSKTQPLSTFPLLDSYLQRWKVLRRRAPAPPLGEFGWGHGWLVFQIGGVKFLKNIDTIFTRNILIFCLFQICTSQLVLVGVSLRQMNELSGEVTLPFSFLLPFPIKTIIKALQALHDAPPLR